MREQMTDLFFKFYLVFRIFIPYQEIIDKKINIIQGSIPSSKHFIFQTNITYKPCLLMVFI